MVLALKLIKCYKHGYIPDAIRASDFILEKVAKSFHKLPSEALSKDGRINIQDMTKLDCPKCDFQTSLKNKQKLVMHMRSHR